MIDLEKTKNDKFSDIETEIDTETHMNVDLFYCVFLLIISILCLLFIIFCF